MSIRLNPLSRSFPILVRSARQECEATQLGELYAANPKIPETTPSHQIQILAHNFAHVHAQVLAQVLAYVFTYVLAYVPAHVPTPALNLQVATGCHLDGSGRSAVATGRSAVTTGCNPECPGR